LVICGGGRAEARDEQGEHGEQRDDPASTAIAAAESGRPVHLLVLSTNVAGKTRYLKHVWVRVTVKKTVS